MPKVGMEPIRRDALVRATIAELGAAGTLDVTVAQIARRAGVSSALAHHYFGGKDDMLVAALRVLLGDYGLMVRTALAAARTTEERLTAIVRASFSEPNFTPEVISAWLNFYVHAQTNEAAARLLRIYQRRLVSNLAHALRPRLGSKARPAAEALAGLIDGLYIRQSLGDGPGIPPVATVLAYADLLCREAPR